MPIWIECGDRIKDLDILEYIKVELIGENESVTVLCKDYCSGLRTDWCNENGWKCLPYSCMIGCEDKCIVAIGKSFQPT